MSAKGVCILALFCCAVLLPIGQLRGQSLPARSARPATRPVSPTPSGSPQPTGFKLEIREIVKPIADLERLTPEELAAATNQTAGAIYSFSGGLDLAVPTKLTFATRVPGAKSQGAKAGVSYEKVTATVDVSGTWKHDQADVKLKIELNNPIVLGEVADAKAAPQPLTLERTVQASESKPAIFTFEDKPTPMGEKAPSFGRLHVGKLTVKQAAAAATAPSAPTPGPQLASLRFEVFAVSAERAKIDTADLSGLLADSLTGEDVLRRLGRYGNAYQVSDIRAVLDLAEGGRLVTSARVPTVMDAIVSASGTVVPSVTYEMVGTILGLKPSRWERAGDRWASDVDIKMETSGIGESAVTTSQGIKLPTFANAMFQGRQRLQSGKPECFVCRGSPVPANENGLAQVYVLRCTLTREE